MPRAKVMSLDEGVPALIPSLTSMCCATAMTRIFNGIKAPSTVGTFLRGFTFGHVRQLDAVASRTLSF